MLEVLHAIGPDSWVSEKNSVSRREAMQDLFFDFAVREEEPT